MSQSSPPYELLLGRGTYEIFAAHWPDSTQARLPTIWTALASTLCRRRSIGVDWNNSTLIQGDVAAYDYRPSRARTAQRSRSTAARV